MRANQKVSLKGKVCAKCGSPDHLTRHHIYPRQFFKGTPNNNKKIAVLCETHHEQLEKHIPHHQKLSRRFYETTLAKFLIGLISILIFLIFKNLSQ